MTAAERLPIDVAALLMAGWGLHTDAVHPVRPRWFTGKVLIRCDTPEGSWCLAGGPAAYRSRVARAASYQARLMQVGCRVIPAIRAVLDGELLREDGAHVWTLMRWMDGAPEHDQSRWTGAMLEQLGRAVGQIHRLGRQVLTVGAAPQLVPDQFWAADWHGFDEWARARWELLLDDTEVSGAAQLEPLRDAIRFGFEALPALGTPRVRNLTVAHDDLWTEHVLFTPEGRLSAIIDLDGLDAGDGHGDFAALISDFANLDQGLCDHVVRGYRSECEVSAGDLVAARATAIRHHLLTLIERIRLWQERPERREDLISPLGYWLRSIRAAVELDPDRWAAAILEAARA